MDRYSRAVVLSVYIKVNPPSPPSTLLLSAMHGVMTKAMCASFRPMQEEFKGGQRRKYRKYTKATYVGLLAYIIQDSPKKMLTFRQIMGKLGVFVSGDRKGLENNIRVCLSSNKCFVKVPVDPDSPNAKRNFWKVDESCITPKMLRRHFSDMTAMLPSLIPQGQGKCESGTVLDPPSPASSSKESNHTIKFSSPFSIESLLKKDDRAQLRIPYGQDRGDLCDFRQTPAASSHVSIGNPFYSFTHPDYMYSTSVAGLSRIHAEGKGLSAALVHALCPPHLSYDQTVLSSASPFSHNLSYLRW
ncbi:forkhead box protein H1 isoform X2 [Pygocentrus nattereri]|uniref:forkhead box protein H1 isoform X2 n=1 Tax=Pygocentrus nattereri TaxID=42514 RepID=UPI0008145A1B|nr:forkhead box protein H1 isoform X2 [Pygocentrus nattereri]